MAVDIGRVRKGMQVRSSDNADLGKVAEVWVGTDPTSASARCDEEVCSRIEVRRGLVRKQVLYQELDPPRVLRLWSDTQPGPHP